MFKRLSGLSFFTLLACQVSFGQEVFKTNSFGAGFNFTVGYQTVDIDQYFTGEKIGKDNFGNDINFDIAAVRKNKPSGGGNIRSGSYFSKPANSVYTYGFQGFGAFNSFLLGAELNFALGSKVFGNQYDTITTQGFTTRSSSLTSSRFGGGDVMLDIGFVALRKRGLVVYPMIGVGYAGSGLWLTSDSPNQREYPVVANAAAEDENIQNVFIWTSNVAFDFGLGLQYMFGASTEDRAKGFSLGLRFGYKMQLATDDIDLNWGKNAKDSYDTENVSLPKLGNSGMYVKFLLGFGKIGDNR